MTELGIDPDEPIRPRAGRLVKAAQVPEYGSHSSQEERNAITDITSGSRACLESLGIRADKIEWEQVTAATAAEATALYLLPQREKLKLEDQAHQVLVRRAFIRRACTKEFATQVKLAMLSVPLVRRRQIDEVVCDVTRASQHPKDKGLDPRNWHIERMEQKEPFVALQYLDELMSLQEKKLKARRVALVSFVRHVLSQQSAGDI